MKKQLNHTRWHLMLLTSSLVFITFSILAQGNFQHFYGPGKGIIVKKFDTGYVIVAEQPSGYTSTYTDNSGNEAFSISLGALCDKIVMLPDGYAKWTITATGSTFEKLNTVGVTELSAHLGATFGDILDFTATADGGFAFVSEIWSPTPYGHSNYKAFKLNDALTHQWELTVDCVNSGIQDTVFNTYSGLIIQKTGGELVIGASGFRTIDHGIGYPQTRITKLGSNGSFLGTEVYGTSSFPPITNRFIDLVPTLDDHYITVLDEIDLADNSWEHITVEKPESWSYITGWSAFDIFSGGFSDYYTTIATADNGVIFADRIVRFLDIGQQDTSTIIRNDNAGSSSWTSNFPNKSYDIIELSNGQLAFTGEKDGMVYLVNLNGDGSFGCGAIPDFTPIGNYNNHSYFISNADMTWEDAHTLAKSIGGHIASIENTAENKFINNHISELVFIGLNDAATEGSFTWDSGEPVFYTNFNTICIPCGFNNAAKDYAVMMPWNGTWGFDNQWVVRKFILEKGCAPPTGVDISYLCPLDFPQDAWTIPVAITNNTPTTLPAQTLYLHQDYVGGFPPALAPNLYEQVVIPELISGASATIALLATGMGSMPDITYVDGTAHYHPKYGKYHLSFDPVGLVDPLEVDYYCKKYTTDLSIAITNPTPTFAPNGDIAYTVQITNSGTADAYNIRAIILEENFPTGPNIFPNFVETFTASPIGIAATRNAGNSNTTIECLIGHLPAGQTYSADVIFHMGFGMPIPSQYNLDVSVSSGHLVNDPVPDNNTDTYTFYQNPPSGCSPTLLGYSFLGLFNGHGYYLSNNIAKWEDANIACLQQGGYLTTINNLAENNFLKSVIGYNMPFIGLNDANNEGSLIWANGEQVTYNNSYGNTGNDDYALMNFWDGSWQFYSYWVNKKYILEMDCATPQPVGLTTQQSIAKLETIYPNPSTNSIFIPIKSKEEQNIDLTIYDARGQVILTEKRTIPKGTSTQQFDIIQLPIGVYFVKIFGDNQYQKFVKM